MAKYLFLIQHEPGAYDGLSPDEMQEVLVKYRKWVSRLKQEGAYLASEKLENSGRTLRRHKDDGRLKISDGPYVEGKELVAGFYLVDAVGASYQQTDWPHILELYDQLLALNPSPVVALNRAVAVSRCRGAAAGLAALASVREHPALQRYYLLWAILGKLHAELGDAAQAAACFREALSCPQSARERHFLEQCLTSITKS